MPCTAAHAACDLAGMLGNAGLMNVERHKPELVRRVNAHIKTGHVHDGDELLERALDACEEKSVCGRCHPWNGDGRPDEKALSNCSRRSRG